MAIFKVDVQKVDSVNNFWTNTYLLEAASLDEAHSSAVIHIAGGEQDIHASFITIDKVRTSTITPNDLVFRSQALNLAGTLTTSGNALALFNVVRVELPVAEGRPSRKYYRCGLGGGNMAAGYKWDGGVVTAIESSIADFKTALTTAGTPWVDPQGEIITTIVALEKVGMRQLRRGSKRPTTPVI